MLFYLLLILLTILNINLYIGINNCKLKIGISRHININLQTA